jgi:hypothetical protein
MLWIVLDDFCMSWGASPLKGLGLKGDTFLSKIELGIHSKMEKRTSGRQ